MFGNTLGWILSALLVIATVGAIVLTDRALRLTPPDEFGLNAENASPLTLPDPADILPQKPGASEATSLYAQAIKLAADNRDAFDGFIKSTHSETPAPVAESLKLLTRAAGYAGGSIFQELPETLIHYNNPSEAIMDVERLGNASIRAARIVRKTNPAAAMAHLQAAFALGHRMFEERLTYEQLDAGLQLLAESTAAMKQLARDTGAAEALSRLEAFDAQRLSLTKTRVLPIAGRIRTLDGQTISANLGNVRRWSLEKSADRVWRVESTLALGRTRFGVGPAGKLTDQKAANRLLEVLVKDEDATVRLAAQQARALTLEQFRQLR